VGLVISPDTTDGWMDDGCDSCQIFIYINFKYFVFLSVTLTCKSCKTDSFSDLSGYTRHCKDFHMHRIFQCPLCHDRSWFIQKDLKEHFEGHKSKYFCLSCETFQNIATYRRHQSWHISRKEVAFCAW
jgi:hypothetical protein